MAHRCRICIIVIDFSRLVCSSGFPAAGAATGHGHAPWLLALALVVVVVVGFCRAYLLAMTDTL